MGTEAIRAVQWPRVPREVQGVGGLIRVRFAKNIRVDGDRCYGAWNDERRIIQLAFGMTREHQWKILYHELVHAAVHDTGIRRLLTEDSEEALCDALATARVAEHRAQLEREQTVTFSTL